MTTIMMRECIQISKTSCTFTMFLLTATLRWSPLVNDHVHNHEHLSATIAAALKTFNYPGSRVLLAPTGALYATPIKKFHLTSSFSSKSHFDLLTLLKNYTQPTPLNHWGWWYDDADDVMMLISMVLMPMQQHISECNHVSWTCWCNF